MRTDIHITRDVVTTTCDCSEPCGWVHRKQDGPSRYWLNNTEVSKDAALAALQNSD
jgi:hypothetical protein